MRLEPNLLEDETGNCIFFSPEQIKGEEVDARTDIYSLGSILYYLVSGQSAYSQIGKNLDKNIAPPVKYNPAVPKSLESIIMKMLSKTPIERYQFVGKILNELSGIKYKSSKPLVQEFFPQTDFSKFLSEKPIVSIPQQLKTLGDQQADGKMKLDFRLLDVICQATGVRYKEARDALIETEGDVAGAIAIVRRKGEEQAYHGEDRIDIKPVADDVIETKQTDIVSRLLFGYFIISGENGDILFYFPAILLFSLLSIPFLFMLSPVIAIIVIVILVIGFLSQFFANIQLDIIDKDTFEFRRRVQMTLTHIATQELSSPPNIGNESIFMQHGFSASPGEQKGEAITVAPSQEKVSPVKRSEQKQSAKEEKPAPSKIEKPAEVKDDIKEKIDHICSRVEGVTPDEARKALEEVDGDQTKAVMNLRRMKRQAAKAPPPEPLPPVREEKPPVREEKPPVREEKPPVREEKPPVREEKASSKPAAGGKNFDPEKIDYVCRRTKVSEDEAIKALEENNGDEIEAVMSIKKKRRRRRE
jgi:NACalpha-BTF3-like transcription factor